MSKHYQQRSISWIYRLGTATVCSVRMVASLARSIWKDRGREGGERKERCPKGREVEEREQKGEGRASWPAQFLWNSRLALASGAPEKGTSLPLFFCVLISGTQVQFAPGATSSGGITAREGVRKSQSTVESAASAVVDATRLLLHNSFLVVARRRGFPREGDFLFASHRTEKHYQS